MSIIFLTFLLSANLQARSCESEASEGTPRGPKAPTKRIQCQVLGELVFRVVGFGVLGVQGLGSVPPELQNMGP